jgi:CheY-like chemotaxis protein
MDAHLIPGEVIIVVVDDDDGHAELIQEHLQEAGLHNPILRFDDGQAVLDFLFKTGPGPHRLSGQAYLLLLDIRMPKVDGVQVLQRMKADVELRNIPVIMLSTTDDPREVEACYRLGCSCYITKPVEFDKFAETLKRLGLFIVVMQFPRINGAH